jgi:PAS domain S-box-containing protein
MQSKPRRKPENSFITLLNFIADPATIVDGKGRFLIVNEAFTNLSGLREKELIGTSFLDLSIINAENKAILAKNLEKRMKGLPVQPYEINFTDKTGEVRFVELKAKKIDYSEQLAYLVIIRDITRRKANERRLKEYSEKMEAFVNEKVKEIKESNEKLEGIFESSPYAITEVDLKGKILECNKMALEQQGCSSKDELIGKSCFELVAPKDRPKARRSFRKALKEGGLKRVELTITNKKGDTFVVSLSAKLMKDASGKPRGFVTITKNIAERKQMEMKLREAEKRYHALFNKAPLGILLIDQTGTAVEFNTQAHRQLGYTRKEFAKLTVSDYEVLETPEETRARMKKVLREGKDEFETKHRTKNGEIRDVINTVQVIELAGKKFFHMITQDITEKKKIENELKLERDKLEAVAKNISAGLTIIGRDYRILWANELLKKLGNIENKLCYATYNNLDKVCPDCGVKKVFEDGVELDRHEYSFKDDKGKTQWVELIVTPIKDEKGNVTAALELSVFITEKKLLQKKLEEYSQHLEKLIEARTKELKQTQAKLVKSERLATIGELAAMVGHDLRNPLTGIRGATYYLKAKCDTKMDAKGKEMLDVIDECIGYSNKIIDDLFDYSREIRLGPAKTNPQRLLRQSLSIIKIPRNIRVVNETEAEPKIVVDTAKMKRVFVNIIKNAVDAMPEGGRLTVTSNATGGNVVFSFTDTGIGMTKETVKKLGSPLFTTKARGMGFGLAICRRIAEAHGGKIAVDSTAGKGTTVTVTIPVRPKQVNEGEEFVVFNEAVPSAVTATQRTRNANG